MMPPGDIISLHCSIIPDEQKELAELLTSTDFPGFGLKRTKHLVDINWEI